MTDSSDDKSVVDRAPRQYLTFDLAGELFAIPILAVQEIRGWEAVSRTPHSPGYVLGVMNLRGAVVPILDLRSRLGMEPSDRTSTSVVIVSCPPGVSPWTMMGARFARAA